VISAREGCLDAWAEAGGASLCASARIELDDINEEIVAERSIRVLHEYRFVSCVFALVGGKQLRDTFILLQIVMLVYECVVRLNSVLFSIERLVSPGLVGAPMEWGLRARLLGS
jgi:hypothetical protein